MKILQLYFLNCLKVDLKMALKAGVYINIDNEQEAAVLDDLLRSDPDCKTTASKIGLRVNPVVGGGSISLFNVGTAASKFGLPITDDTRERDVFFNTGLTCLYDNEFDTSIWILQLLETIIRYGLRT